MGGTNSRVWVSIDTERFVEVTRDNIDIVMPLSDAEIEWFRYGCYDCDDSWESKVEDFESTQAAVWRSLILAGELFSKDHCGVCITLSQRCHEHAQDDGCFIYNCRDCRRYVLCPEPATRD